MSTALDLAIQNYDQLPLAFAMARTPSSGCSFTINAMLGSGTGGSAGFPSGGQPFSTITIGSGLASFDVNTIEHVITHELGHTIGFRHSDFFNRSISCGIGGNEGDAGVGAVLISGTPSGAAVGGSVMNSCFRTLETGEFTGSDVVALFGLYPSSATTRDLVLYWGAVREDNFTTGTFTGIADAVGAGYAFARREGGIFVSQQPGTVPLRLYWGATRGDNFSTATNAGAADALAAGYSFVRNEGYVYPIQQPGTVPLRLFYSDPRGDNFTTATDAGAADALAAGYSFVRIEGYVFP